MRPTKYSIDTSFIIHLKTEGIIVKYGASFFDDEGEPQMDYSLSTVGWYVMDEDWAVYGNYFEVPTKDLLSATKVLLDRAYSLRKELKLSLPKDKQRIEDGI